MGRVMGIEPTTYWTTTSRSNLLSYTRRVRTVPAACIMRLERISPASVRFFLSKIQTAWRLVLNFRIVLQEHGVALNSLTNRGGLRQGDWLTKDNYNR